MICSLSVSLVSVEPDAFDDDPDSPGVIFIIGNTPEISGLLVCLCLTHNIHIYGKKPVKRYAACLVWVNKYESTE